MIRFVACILLGVLTSSCHPCADEVVWSKASQNGDLTATVFYRDCGATTKEVTWLTIHRSSASYDRPDDIALTADHMQTIDLTWIDNSHLSVRCRSCRRDEVHHQANSVRSVQIRYQFDAQ